MTRFCLIVAFALTPALLLIPNNNPITGLAHVIATEWSQREKRAVFKISRQANDANTKPFLEKALHDNILSASKYYGELGHMLSVEVPNPGEILQEIIDSGDKYGYEVALGAIASTPPWVSTISQQELQFIAATIQSHKPVLGGHVSELGFSDIFTYQNWLRALMNLQPNRQAQLALVSELIEHESEDPRVAIAIEYEMADSELLRLSGQHVRDTLKRKVAHYLASYPNNRVANYIAIERYEN